MKLMKTLVSMQRGLKDGCGRGRRVWLPLGLNAKRIESLVPDPAPCHLLSPSQCKEDWKQLSSWHPYPQWELRLNAKRIERAGTGGNAGGPRASLNAKRIESCFFLLIRLPDGLVSMQRGLKESSFCCLTYVVWGLNAKRIERGGDPEGAGEMSVRSQCKEDWKPWWSLSAIEMIRGSQCKEDWKFSRSGFCRCTGSPSLNAKRIERCKVGLLGTEDHAFRLNAKRIERDVNLSMTYLLLLPSQCKEDWKPPTPRRACWGEVFVSMQRGLKDIGHIL